MTSPKLLLTSVCRPFGPRFGDSTSVGYELLHEQVTRAQGLFSPRALIHHFSLEYLAHNVEAPSVVLQYPSEKELIRELKGGYDFVGISFVLATFHRMKRVSELVRRYAPKAKIILGGYGTVLSNEELLPWGDEICREEGVAFLRRILGESTKPMPYDHPLLVNGLKIFSLPVGNNGMILGGLGCPNGCDFCATTHFFKRKHIRLLPEGDDIFTLVRKYREFDPGIKFTVLDEDFLLNQKRARRFLELVRASGEDPPSMFVFASIKALSQYTIEELLEMGVSGVWIGYEGQRSGYEKQKGRDTRELFRELRSHGIHILASMIIGFDYQTPEIIEQEMSDLLELQPTFAQFLIYGPTPGTPFFERIQKEERLVDALRFDPELYYKKCTGFYGMVRHPMLSSAELEAIQRKCFRSDFERLGPSIIRSIESWFLGYQRLKKSNNPLLVRRAAIYREDILNGMPALFPAAVLGPSLEARRRARELEAMIAEELPVRTWMQKIKSGIAFMAAVWTGICLKYGWFQHPRVVRLTYPYRPGVPRTGNSAFEPVSEGANRETAIR